jgi:hypothetical protein
MNRSAPCNDESGEGAARSARSEDADDGAQSPSRALRHYERAIQALAGTTYGGLSGPERRHLLDALCREKQRLVNGTGDPR